MHVKIKKTKVMLQEFLILLCSYYFMKLINSITLTTNLQRIFVFLYFAFLFHIIAFFFGKISKQKEKKWIYMILSVCISFLLLVSCYDKMNNKFIYMNQMYDIMIQNIESSSSLAQGNEIWIKSITINEEIVDLEEIELPQGWYFKDGNLVSYDTKAEPLFIKDRKGSDVEIVFVGHTWCGNAAIQAESYYITQELTREEAQDISLTFDMADAFINTKVSNFYAGIVFIILSILTYMIIQISFWRYHKIDHAVLLGLALYILGADVIPSVTIKILILFTLPNFMSYAKKSWYKWKIGRKIMSILLALYMAIACIGRETILIQDEYVPSFSGMLKLLTFSIYCFILIGAFSNIFEKIANMTLTYEIKNYQIEKKKFIRRDKRIRFILSVVLALITISALDDFILKRYQPTQVSIEATGEVGETKKGNEILIDKIKIDGKEMDLDDIQLTKDWKKFSTNSIIYNKSNEKAEITINFPKAGDIKIYFYLYNVGGIGKITDGKKQILVDFSSEDKSYTNHFYIYEVSSNVIQENIFILILKYGIGIFIFTFIYWYIILLCQKYNRRNKDYQIVAAEQKCFYLIWIITFLCLNISIYAFYPGNWSWDNLYQWAQATGMCGLDPGHPIFMTLGMRVLIAIYPSPMAIMMFIAVITATVLASILTYCYKKGLKLRNLIIVGILICFLPNVIIMVTNPLKDTFHSIALIYVLFFAILINDNDKEFKNNIYYIVFLPIVLMIVDLLRHEAVIVYTILVFIFCYYGFRKKNIVLIISALFSIVCISGFQMSTQNLVTKKNDTEKALLSPMYKGIENIIAHDLPLAEKTELYFTEVMPLEKWKELYRPYDADKLGFDEEYKTGISNSEHATVPDILSCYLIELFRYPSYIIMDRLNGADLLWDVADNPRNPIFYGHDGVMTFYMVGPSEFGLIPDENGNYQSKNIFSNFIRSYIEISKNGIGKLIWNIGFSIIIFLIFFIQKEYKSYRFVGIAIIGRIITWALLLRWAHYRYVFSILAMIYLWIIINLILERNKRLQKED